MTDEEQSFVAEVMPNMEAKLFAAKDGADQNLAQGARVQAEPERAVGRDA